jgi:hypothetical protein
LKLNAARGRDDCAIDTLLASRWLEHLEKGSLPPIFCSLAESSIGTDASFETCFFLKDPSWLQPVDDL